MRQLSPSACGGLLSVLVSFCSPIHAEPLPALEESTLEDETLVSVINDEFPFIDGVFAREVGEPLKVEETAPPDFPEILFDEDGNSNQLIVLLNLEDAHSLRVMLGSSARFEDRASAEALVVASINEGSAQASSYFVKPTRAWHLIWRDRLDAEDRKIMEDEAPDELLQRYIVLNYATPEAARSAMAELRLKRDIDNVEIDQKFEFSWAPNDYYFPIVPSSADLYQWGIHSMQFPAAWEVTRGHGHVGILDGGLTQWYSTSGLSAKLSSSIFICSRYARPHI